MRQHLCIFCMGSNIDYNLHIPYVRKRLKEHFDDITFQKEIITKPINIDSDSMFMNQVGFFYTSQGKDDVNCFFKQLEKECGRSDEDKSKSLIKMDIDLIIYDDIVLKPDDINYPHIAEAIKNIKNELYQLR